jgi:hypothetical protein
MASKAPPPSLLARQWHRNRVAIEDEAAMSGDRAMEAGVPSGGS